ncbi:acyl-CoA dehydrogenase family protein [Mycolicibacterium brisbanense]|uniref:acyl-CoA dehydrogenase family protein n=1 Tax=Mycolicibacterium brisbanense TaxID=146020 RepID=UPI000A775E2D|nr:acyl-CoA dehydrogenase family protein [Mycolicibacterium brisbanense]
MDSALCSALDEVVGNVIGPAAAAVDTGGDFPRESVDALAKAGFLGLLSAPEFGGSGGSLGDAAEVVRTIASVCGSTAMVLTMHYAAVSVLERFADDDARSAIATGRHLSTLAFSEVGSRSHFWAPVGTAARGDGDTVLLDSRKSWVTSAGHADSYVWSSRPLAAEGPMTLWHVPASAEGLAVAGSFDGLGLRGNSSAPMTATQLAVPASAMLGGDGQGLDLALESALPTFLVLNAAFSLGLMRALIAAAGTHLAGSRLQHLDQSLAEQPEQRRAYARLLTLVDGAALFVDDTLAALATGRADAMLRVLQVKAVAAEAASEVADGVMRLCGGSAFRKELGIERRFRDSLAARVMAPTTEALHDFVGRAAFGQPLL